MAELVYNEFKRALAEAEFDLGAGGSDIRAALLMSGTTADTEDDVNTLSGFTTLDDHDGSGYARVSLTNAIVENAGLNEVQYIPPDFTFTTVSKGTTETVMLFLFKHVTNDTDSVPFCSITDDYGLPADQYGEDLTFDTVTSFWSLG